MSASTPLSRKSFELPASLPAPGSAAEREEFNRLQQLMLGQFEKVFPDKLAPRTVVIVPSLSLDQEILAKIKGALHYEERMLCLLMLLRMPRTKVIYVTSIPVPEVIVDYYLHLLPGITGDHARKRLTLLSCFDSSPRSLTQKILERPRLLQLIKDHIEDPASSHLTCFNITPLEKTLSVHLGIPLFGTDPDKFYEGSKSGGRKTFRSCGVSLPDGFEDLHTEQDITRSLAALKRKYPAMRKAVVKMNDGFSGDGNAMYRFGEVAIDDSLEKNIAADLHARLKPVAAELKVDMFLAKFQEMGGIVEEFLEGEEKRSPSVQCVINPNKSIDIVSTHDQLLGGEDGQIFLGAVFPADTTYNVSLAEEGRKIARALAEKGAMGRFAVDFISVQEKDGNWKHYAIEINLRKGGTTHPFLMLQFLTDGKYLPDKGEFVTASGNRRCYFASDNVTSERYKGLTPEDLINIAMFHSLMFDGTRQEGVMFHLVGALSEYGKLGLVCIGATPEAAKAYYDRTIEVLDWETSL